MRAISSDELVHYGIKGMKWGVRKDDERVGRAVSATIPSDPGIHKTTRDAAAAVSGMLAERYGYRFTSLKTIGPGHPEYPGTMAFVGHESDSPAGTIYVQNRNLTPHLKHAEEVGWMVPGTANQKGLLTHESAHSIFHAKQTLKPGFFAPKLVGGNIEARDKALKAAVKTSKSEGKTVWEISGYANTAHNRVELEAEFFSQYHWATNPSKAVVAWGETLHRELGVDPTPFKDVKSRG